MLEVIAVVLLVYAFQYLLWLILSPIFNMFDKIDWTVADKEKEMKEAEDKKKYPGSKPWV